LAVCAIGIAARFFNELQSGALIGPGLFEKRLASSDGYERSVMTIPRRRTRGAGSRGSPIVRIVPRSPRHLVRWSIRSILYADKDRLPATTGCSSAAA